MKKVLKYFKELSLFEKIMVIILIVECIAVIKFRWIIGIGDSMYPTLKNPSFTICMKTNDYEVGDIVHYRLEGKPIIHRIIDIKTYYMSDGSVVRTYKLQGDNNPTADPFEVYKENLVCKVLFVK